MTDPDPDPDADDPYQLLVYAAEDGAVLDGGRRFTRFAHLEAWVAEVVTSEWWSATFPHAPVDVDVVRRSASASGSASHVEAAGHAGVLLIRPGHWTAVTAVHELAHLTSWWHPPSEGSHGPTFTADLLVLWRRLLGAHAYGALRSALDERGVPYRLDRLARSER